MITPDTAHKFIELRAQGLTYKTIPTARLFTLTNLSRQRLEREIGNVTFSQSVDVQVDAPTQEVVQKWTA